MDMPLKREIWLYMKLQKNRRVQVPMLVRRQYKLQSGEVFRVKVFKAPSEVSFLGKLTKCGRLTIPKIILKKIEARIGNVVRVTLGNP